MPEPNKPTPKPIPIDHTALMHETMKSIHVLMNNQTQIQAETNRLLSTLNNNIIAISNNQNDAEEAKHLQVLGELQAINHINAGSCEMMKQISEKPSEIGILTKIFDDILAELKSTSDEGETRFISTTATTTVTIYDFEKDRDPYHNIKSILMKNDGAVTVQFAINNPDTVHFSDLKPDEAIPIKFNQRKISKLFIKTSSSTSAFRMWYSW